MKADLLVLDCDKVAAQDRINEIEAEILSLGPEFYEAFTQTSETWHDNAPFEVVRDRQTLLAAERHRLKQMLNSCQLRIPKQPKNKVGIGSIVDTKNISNNTTTKYFIAGDWTSRAGEKDKGAIIVSRQSPIAKLMLSKKVGDEIIFNKSKIIIVDISKTEV